MSHAVLTFVLAIAGTLIFALSALLWWFKFSFPVEFKMVEFTQPNNFKRFGIVGMVAFYSAFAFFVVYRAAIRLLHFSTPNCVINRVMRFHSFGVTFPVSFVTSFLHRLSFLCLSVFLATSCTRSFAGVCLSIFFIRLCFYNLPCGCLLIFFCTLLRHSLQWLCFPSFAVLS